MVNMIIGLGETSSLSCAKPNSNKFDCGAMLALH